MSMASSATLRRRVASIKKGVEECGIQLVSMQHDMQEHGAQCSSAKKGMAYGIQVASIKKDVAECGGQISFMRLTMETKIDWFMEKVQVCVNELRDEHHRADGCFDPLHGDQTGG